MYDVPKLEVSASSITTDLLSASSTSDTIVALAVESSLPFIALLTALIAVTFLRPQIYCPREFYQNCFKSCWWPTPPRKWMFDLVWFVMDSLTIASMAHYLFNNRNPANGSDENWYIAIYSLFIVYLGLRWFWINAFWNYHNKKTFVKGDMVYSWEVTLAIGFAIVFIILAIIAVTIIAILFAIQSQWWPLGLIILPWLWLILLAVWTIYIYMCLPHCARICRTVPLCNKKQSKNLV